ncbi:MAG TPA: hypothetical protein VI636_09170 [Candidatus Angelobacter sp.]
MLRTKVWILSALVLVIVIPAVAQRHAAPEKITQGPVIEGIGDNWAVIAWTTDTGGSTIVRYGADPKHLDQWVKHPIRTMKRRLPKTIAFTSRT